MKKTIAIVLGCAFAAAPALAQWDGPYYDRDQTRYDRRDEFARVIDSQPVYAAGREECWNPRTQAYEERRDERHGLGAGTAVGAVAGGVLGNQVHHGEGAVAGAILGGIVGHQIEKHDRADENALDTSNCRVASSDANGIEGYDVRYRYRGQEYVTRMAYDPGSSLRVGQDINWDGSPLG